MRNIVNIKIKSVSVKIIVGTAGILGIILFLSKIIGGYLNTEDRTLAIGDKVIVQNAVAADGREGVYLRVNPGRGIPRKGSVFNGAIGTIMKGPEDGDDHRWWKIQWDAEQGEDKIKWSPAHPCNKPPCEAWIAEIVNGAVVLSKKN